MKTEEEKKRIREWMKKQPWYVSKKEFLVKKRFEFLRNRKKQKTEYLKKNPHVLDEIKDAERLEYKHMKSRNYRRWIKRS